MSSKQLEDPECPVELWWSLAVNYPIEAMQSILYDLMTLEEPERWVQLEEDHIQDWIDTIASGLPPMQQELFAADCAERVLPIFERAHPDDKRPRKAIHLRRLFAANQASREAWIEACAAANEAALEAKESGASDNGAAADAAFACTRDADGAAQSAVWAASDAEADIITDGPAAWAAVYRESRWQWKRLQAYLRGEVPTN